MQVTDLSPATLALVPAPAKLERRLGRFRLEPATTIVAPKELRGTAVRLSEDIGRLTGLRLAVRSTGSRGQIRLALDARLRALGPEGYRLSVDADGVEILARAPAGAFYGVQTLRQLLPWKQAAGQIELPWVEIEDAPRFVWRGMHLDVGRHFMPKAFILKFLDLLALHKFNTFHWHLTEDQGWRIEIKKYPRLTEVGSKRKDSMLVYDPPQFTGEPHGGFYTQDEVREIVRYASERFITVVPEIEMPGHAQAAIAAYPELGNGEAVEVGTRWGVYENVFNVKDSTVRFLHGVLDEVLELFPSPFIHIGGDECPKKQWKAGAFAQEKMRRLGLKDEHELQSWFIRQMDAHLTAKGRRLIGWSEILEGGLAPGAALMVWLGDQGAMEAVSSGHDVVMAQTTHTYLDYYQSQNRAKEPHAIGGFLPLEKVYSYEPILQQMTPEQAKHVLGAQGQLWTEYMRTPEHVEYMAFPRACALAEVVWSPKASRNWDDFSGRLPFHLDRLTALGVNFRKLEPGAGAERKETKESRRKSQING